MLANDALRRKLLSVLTPIERQVAKCQKCKIALTRTRTVFGKGNPLAQLVVLGEGPGQEEDHDGIPFTGKAGKLLHRGLEAIGHNEKNTYFCNVLKCRACDVMDSGWHKNRTPDAEEIANCAPYLKRQLEALPNKKVILAVGSTAMHWLLGADPASLRIGNIRGKLLKTPFENVVGVATYHPSYLLRPENAEHKAGVYEDFKLAKQYVEKGEYDEEKLRSRNDFADWNQALPRPAGPEEERRIQAQRTGKLLPSQKDRYTTQIWVDDVPVEIGPPPGSKLEFGAPPKKQTKRKAAAVTDDDIPF